MGTFKKIAKNVGRYTYKPVVKTAYKAVKTVAKPVVRTVKSSVNMAERAAKQAAEQAQRLGKQAIRTGQQAVKGVSSGVKGVGKVVGKADDVWKDYLRKPVRQVGAVTLPIAGAMIGGPIGLAAGLQGAARLPEFKEGWKKNASYLGMDERDAMRLANYGSLGAGAYGLGSMAFGGSPTSWSFGGSGQGLFGLGGGAAGKGTLAQMATPTASIGEQMTAAGLQPGNAWASSGLPGYGLASDVATPLSQTIGQTVGKMYAAAPSTAPSAGSMASHGWGWFQPGAQAVTQAGNGSSIFGGLLGKGTMGTIGKGLGLAGGGLLLANMLKTPKAPKQEAIPMPEEYPADAFVSPGMVMDPGPYNEEISGIGSQIQGYGNDILAQYQSQFSPLNAMIAQRGANGYDPNYYADRYSAELAQRLNAEQMAARRNMERMGINPNSPRYASQEYDLALGASQADAAARQQGRQWAEEASRAALLDAANFGVGLQNTGINALGSAANLYGGLNSNYINQLNNSAQIAQSNAALRANYYDQLNDWRAANAALPYQNAMANYQGDLANQQGLTNLIGTIGGTLLGRYIFA